MRNGAVLILRTGFQAVECSAIEALQSKQNAAIERLINEVDKKSARDSSKHRNSSSNARHDTKPIMGRSKKNGARATGNKVRRRVPNNGSVPRK